MVERIFKPSLAAFIMLVGIIGLVGLCCGCGPNLTKELERIQGHRHYQRTTQFGDACRYDLYISGADLRLELFSAGLGSDTWRGTITSVKSACDGYCKEFRPQMTGTAKKQRVLLTWDSTPRVQLCVNDECMEE